MTVKFNYGTQQLGPKFKLNVKRFSAGQVAATQAAARRAKDEIETQGRANIRQGGRFGSARWQQGFKAKLSFQSKTDITIRVTHDVKYWVVFEEGRTIRGRPLLWIPLSFGQAAADNIRARDYPKPLFRVDRPGRAPLLLDDSGPQYFGKESVTIPRKWHLRDIVKRIARNMGQYYKEAFRRGGKR
jgi:hypothetical protein